MRWGEQQKGIVTRGAALALVMFLLHGVLLLSAGEGEGASGPVVKKIVVGKSGGVATIPVNRIKSTMGTREGQPFDQKILDEDYERLMRLPEVRDVQIRKKEVDGGLELTVMIEEKEVIHRIQFRGNKKQRNKNLEELVQSKIGGRYDAGQVNRDIRAIEDHYKEKFFYFVKVEAKKEIFEDGVRLVFEIDESGQLWVKKVIFRGNKAFRAKELTKYMETRASTFFTKGKYDRRIFEKDLQRLNMFYQSEGYLDVKINERPFEIVRGKGGLRGKERSLATIYIDIEEGDLYRVGRVDFKGNKLVPTDQLRDVVETTPGDVFSPVTARKDANTIRDIYGKYPSSRYFTEVLGERIDTEKGPVVDVEFRIKEGEEVVVEDVQVLGLEKTQMKVVLREIEQLPGDKIDSEKINFSKRNIHNLGYFKVVDFQVKPGSDPQKRAKVVVDVEEQPTGKFVLGAGVSTRESFIGSIQLQQRNFSHRDWPKSWKDFFLGKAFSGGGQNFNLNLASGSKSENYRFDFTEPWLFDKPVRFGLGGKYWRYSWNKYDEERKGGYLRLGKRLFGNRNLNGSITYRLEDVTLSDFENDVSDELKREEGSNWISRGVLNLTYDSRDSRWDPTKGLLLSGTQEFAGTVFGGDKDFWRSFAEINYFHQIWKDKHNRPWVIGMKADLGMTEAFGDDEHVPVYEKMYLGGIGSLRGFKYHTVSPRDDAGDEIGGELSNAYTVELFVPLYENIIRVSTFYDLGAVWAQLDEMDGDPWRSSWGVGVHVKTPLGPVPIRLYYSQALDEVDGDETRSFQFTFGAFF